MIATVSAAFLQGRLTLAAAHLVSSPLGPSDVDPDDIRDEACSVTAPSRICTPEATRSPDPPDAPDVPDVGVLAGIADLVTLVITVALAIGLAWLIFRLVRGARRSPREDGDDVEPDLDESVDGVLGARVVDHDTPPGEWRRRADDHAAHGEYRDAVRCRYRALVGDLARAGYVDEIAGRTSGEERAQVASTVIRLARTGHADPPAGHADIAGQSAQVTMSFDRAAGTFDAAWFDDELVSVGDLDGFVADERVVLDAVASGPSNRRSRVGSTR